MLTTLDYVVLVGYLIGVAAFGILVGGRQQSTRDYFLGGRNLPWWAVSFSVVATETSTLTVISVPAVAYGGSMTFLQLTFGYLLGRVLVAIVFLPRYFQGELTTAYGFLGARFGDRMRATASVTFLLTRLLADGVRLFATAIPLRLLALAAGIDVSYFEIILLIGVVTIIYTLIGGIKAVVWMDVVQMVVYVGGAVFAVGVLLADADPGWWSTAAAAGKTQVVNMAFEGGLTEWLTSPYAFVTAVVGGAVFTMASHGTDQLIVQRLLACRNVGESQKALVMSGVVVLLQFALFLFVGLLLWVHYQGASMEELGLTRADEVFPRFIIQGLPPGVTGLLLAGIVAAAMSTLSSSLNSLASSSMSDLFERFSGRELSPAASLRLSRVFTFIWGGVFIGFANLFEDQSNPVVELGLAIASFTYGGLLGAFLLGLLVRRADQTDAIISFILTVGTMVFIIFGLWYVPEAGWTFRLQLASTAPAEGALPLAWPWYTVLGSCITLLSGSLLALRHR